MKFTALLAIWLVLEVKVSNCWSREILFQARQSIHHHHHNDDYSHVDPGQPLVLTDLIESNKFDEARDRSKVSHPEFFGIKSYSGFFTVNKAFDSALFFWFFPAEEDYANAPVILWLEGGPGESSLIGLLVSHGPFRIVSNDTIELRTHRWNKKHSVLYIDNPVGTGFSYTNNGYSKNETEVGKNLYEALQQFFKLFPELQKNDFFVTGESYGGKYVPAIAYKIHQENPRADIKINLKGIAIDSGLSDPIHQSNFSDYLYQIGMIDHNVKKEMEVMQDNFTNLVNNKQWLAGYNELARILELYVSQSNDYLLYNYLEANYSPFDFINFIPQYVNRNDIRKAIHVGNLPYSSDNVSDNLLEDFVQSVAPWVSELLGKYRVLLYNGQVDVVVAYPLTVNYLQTLDFDAAAEYKVAPRRKWNVGEELAGYVKTAGNLTEVMVRKAGHLVVYDQPEWTYDLIYKFVRNIPIA